MILIALFKDKNLHTRSNKFIRNLAFADLCVGAWTMSVTFSSMINQAWVFNLTFIKFVTFSCIFVFRQDYILG